MLILHIRCREGDETSVITCVLINSAPHLYLKREIDGTVFAKKQQTPPPHSNGGASEGLVGFGVLFLNDRYHHN